MTILRGTRGRIPAVIGKIKAITDSVAHRFKRENER